MSYSVCLSLAKRFPSFKGKGKGKSKGNVLDRDHEPGIHDPFGRDSISGRDDSRDDQDDVDDVYDEDDDDDNFENDKDGDKREGSPSGLRPDSSSGPRPDSSSGPRPDHNLGSGPITIWAPARRYGPLPDHNLPVGSSPTTIGAPARSQSGLRPDHSQMLPARIATSDPYLDLEIATSDPSSESNTPPPKFGGSLRPWPTPKIDLDDIADP